MTYINQKNDSRLDYQATDITDEINDGGKCGYFDIKYFSP